MCMEEKVQQHKEEGGNRGVLPGSDEVRTVHVLVFRNKCLGPTVNTTSGIEFSMI